MRKMGKNEEKGKASKGAFSNKKGLVDGKLLTTIRLKNYRGIIKQLNDKLNIKLDEQVFIALLELIASPSIRYNMCWSQGVGQITFCGFCKDRNGEVYASYKLKSDKKQLTFLVPIKLDNLRKGNCLRWNLEPANLEPPVENMEFSVSMVREDEVKQRPIENVDEDDELKKMKSEIIRILDGLRFKLSFDPEAIKKLSRAISDIEEGRCSEAISRLEQMDLENVEIIKEIEEGVIERIKDLESKLEDIEGRIELLPEPPNFEIF